jgi:pimeloyl-ACP methyl ester carboxylesterase
MSIHDKFFIREYGLAKDKAPSLVFIHGLLGWGLNWGPVLKYFEEDYHIITYDQRGHGRSFQPDTGYAPEDYAEDLAEILKSLEIKSAHIIGHSMGARTAQTFAVNYPGQTKSLVIEDMGPNPENTSTMSTQQMILSVPAPFKSKKDVDAFFDSEFKVKTAADDTQKSVMANFLKANLTRNSEGEITWRFHLKGILETLEQGLKPRWSEFKCIEVPTLILKGENSKHLSLETFNIMKDSLPGAEAEVIPNVGHWIHYQAPEVFSQYVLKFLRKLS